MEEAYTAVNTEQQNLGCIDLAFAATGSYAKTVSRAERAAVGRSVKLLVPKLSNTAASPLQLLTSFTA